MTQTEDNEVLKTRLYEKPNFNPLACPYVKPRHSIENKMKIEKEISITIDYLNRGVVGFDELKDHLQNNILSMVTDFYKKLESTFVKCIRCYHFQFESNRKWNDNMFNLATPIMNNYLKGDCLFKADSKDQQRLAQATTEIIQKMQKDIMTVHERDVKHQASAAWESTIISYEQSQNAPLLAAWCELHELNTLQKKGQVLNIIQRAHDLVCKFAFPDAVKKCRQELDNIMESLVFEQDEAHVMQLSLPFFKEEFTFCRDSELPSKSKEQVMTSTSTPQTPATSKREVI